MSSGHSDTSDSETESLDDVNKKTRDSLECEDCKTHCENKSQLKIHRKSCVKWRTCKWCKIVFRNRGNLVTHAFHVHGDASFKNDNQPASVCEVCNVVVRDSQYLRYHIRHKHYNLQAKNPLFNLKKINDVWFEEVLNSNVIAELHKITDSRLLIQKFDPCMEIQTEGNPEIIDLTHLYPTKQRTQKIKCDVCGILILKRVYKKHFDEKHSDEKHSDEKHSDEKHSDVVKHQCNLCKATFKRSNFFVRHVCNKPRKSRRQIIITRVESLKSIPV